LTIACLLFWQRLATAVPPSSESDANLARQVLGTWEADEAHQPTDSILKKAFTTFERDQTFLNLAILELGGVRARIDLKGTWRIENGMLVMKITSSSAPGIATANRERIVSISSSEFVTRSAQGHEKRGRKGQIPKFLPPLSSSDIAFFLAKSGLAGRALQQAIIAAPKPVYPIDARRNRKVGKGLFGLIVDKPTGKVTAVRVVVSTGHGILDNAAREALMKWQFKPGIVNKTLVPITFSLTSSGATVRSN
jgi:TonB family protein